MEKPPLDVVVKVSSATVLESAGVIGLPLDDEAVAARIAAGAGAAVAAVREALSHLDDVDALFELESLAEPPVGGPSVGDLTLESPPR
jgi:hypothetical protein